MANNYINLPVEGGGGGVSSLNTLTGDLTLAAGSGITITPSGGNTLTIAATGDGGVTVIGTFDSQAPAANGLVISGVNLYAQSATAAVPGMVNIGTQTFAGAKTFTGAISASNLSGTNTGDVTISTANGLSLVGQALSLALSSTSTTGALSSTDWNTFNNKQASGSYITALTGDVTATGPGSVAATIAVGAVTDTKGSLATKPPVTVVATTNQALSGTPTIDGQTTVAGTSIVLLTAQSTGADNGPWIVQSGAWTRPTWYPTGGTTQAFQFITTLVRLGTTYQGTTWRQTAAAPITIGTTATTWAVTPLALNSSTITGTLPAANLTTNVKTRSFGITYQSATAIATGSTRYITIPYTGAITKWTMLSSVSASMVIDIWKSTYSGALPTIANTIVASAPPTLASATKNTDSTLTGWTTAVTAGDVVAFNITSTSGAVNVNLVVEMVVT